MKRPDRPPACLVITGASRGIGAALAESYAAPGVALGLLGRDGARLDRVAARCRERGAEVTVATIDVRERDAMADWLTRFDAENPVDLVIANAGVSSSIGAAGAPETQADTWRTFDINLGGAINSIVPLIDPMCRRGRGHIAVMCSLAALYGFPNTPAYSASKAGLRMWAEALGRAHRGAGISVSVICPGFVISDMSDRVIGPKPLMVSAAVAVGRIRNGLDRQRRMIAFPALLRWGIWFLDLLPEIAARPLLGLFAYRVADTGGATTTPGHERTKPPGP